MTLDLCFTQDETTLHELKDALIAKGIPPEQGLDYSRGILAVGDKLGGLPQLKIQALLSMLVKKSQSLEFKDRHFLLIEVFQNIVKREAEKV